MRCIALVPALNEAAIIATTVAQIFEGAPGFDVVVIDDGSTDHTAARARAAGARVLRMPFNLGIGGALQAGYLYALEQGYDVAVQVDGDGQHDPRQLALLLDRLLAEPKVNMVTGSRFLEPAADGYRSSGVRRIGIRLLARLVSVLCRRRITDPTSGFRMTDRLAIELFAFDYPKDYPEVEAIMLMKAHRLASAEVPVQMRPRTTGRSTISAARPLYYMVKVVLAILIGTLRSRPTISLGVDSR